MVHELTATVIMPIFNRERSVEAAIRSVIAQTHRNWSLVVIDDGSSDGSAEVVKRLIAEAPECDIQLIECEANKGVSAARNRGLGAATGDVIAYLDSDNAWKPDYLAIMLAALAREPERQSVYCGSELWLRDFETGTPELIGALAVPYDRNRLEQSNFIDLNVFAHRRGLYFERGGFDETMTRLVDWRLILEYTKGAPPLFVPLLLAEYHFDVHAGQITDTMELEENHQKIMDAAGLSQTLS